MVARGRKTRPFGEALNVVRVAYEATREHPPRSESIGDACADASARPLRSADPGEVTADFQDSAARPHNGHRRAWLIASLQHAC
jgi:hypothetical protein